MDTTKSCNVLRQSVVKSGLHYFINESPHSIWITVRKKFMNDSFDINLAGQESTTTEVTVERNVEVLKVEYKALEERHRKLAYTFENLQKEFETVTSVRQETKVANDTLNEDIIKKGEVINNLKQEVKDVKMNLEVSESDAKKSLKIIKGKEKEIYDLKKENVKDKSDLEHIDKELKEVKASVNREKKEQERKSKKQVKKDFLHKLKDEKKVEDIECDLCDSQISTIGTLKTHIRVHHMRPSTTQTDEVVFEEKSVQSTQSKSICDKMFQTGDVINNVKEEFVKYPCYYCGTTIESRNNLTEHKKKCHEKSKKFSPVKSVPFNIRFPPVGFPRIGFPPVNPRNLSPFYSSWAKNSL